MKCGFFGHRNAPPELRSKIKETVIKLIEEKKVAEFYVGNHGNFDTMVLSVLKELSEIYPKINYYVVYAYLSAKCGEDPVHIKYPEGIEKASKRYAIVYRNEWIVKHSDMIVAYVLHSEGGAARFTSLAEMNGAEIIHIN